MLARIGRLKREAERDLLAELDRDLEAAMVLLDEHLARYNVPHDVVRGAERETFAAAMSSLVRSSAARLQRRLAAVNGAEDHEAIHRAHIAGKRLRYALEQVAAAVPGAQACLIRLKVLQDYSSATTTMTPSGSVSSMWRRRARRGSSSGRACARSWRAWQRSATRYTALAEEWLSGGTTALFAALNEVADWLAARGTQGMEVERKYLFTGVPDTLPPGRLQRLEQGYLPGKKLIERVRRAREGRAVKHYRTVKGGKGLARIEVEEQCTRSLFAALWPLTAGRRVLKRRHLIPDGERVWAIDVFTDRALVLAEVELPSTETEVTVPEWLAPYVVREVTEERGFVNAVLAR